MNEQPRVSLLDMALCFSNAVDLVHPSLADHHHRTAYAAAALAQEMGLPPAAQVEVTTAGALHDIGAISLMERLGLIVVETHTETMHQHAERGFALLAQFPPLSAVALLIRHHHRRWQQFLDLKLKGAEVPLASNVLHLADRLAAVLDAKGEILGQVHDITGMVEAETGRAFCPLVVDAFTSLAGKESFWLELGSPFVGSLVARRARELPATLLETEEVLELAELYARAIDFRSRFTVAHSSGVAAAAEALARLLAMPKEDWRLLRTAGYLHDLGKLAVPVSILDKPESLEEAEIRLLRSHSFYTFHVLEPIPGLRSIAQWAGFHHERLDGTGYPFHLKGDDLPLAARVVAVADVFAALREERPHRGPMDKERALAILRVKAGPELDTDIVSLVERHWNTVEKARAEAEDAAIAGYQKFNETLLAVAG